jgi:hypothetical protein
MEEKSLVLHGLNLGPLFIAAASQTLNHITEGFIQQQLRLVVVTNYPYQ